MEMPTPTEAAEGAARLVKLTTSDWKRLAIVLVVIAGATCTLSFNLVARTVRSETESLNQKNAEQDTAIKVAAAKVDMIKDRVNKIELVQSDVVTIKSDVKDLAARMTKAELAQTEVNVIKNDVSWIKQYLEKEQRSKKDN